MKIKNLLWLISLSAAVTLNITSCKDDDKNDEVKPEEKNASVNITVTNDQKTVEGATVYMYSGENYNGESTPTTQNALTYKDNDKDGIAKFTINETDLEGTSKKSFYFVVFNDKSEKTGEVKISLKAGESKEGTIDITPKKESESLSQLSATVNNGKFTTTTCGFWASKSTDHRGTKYLENIFGTLDGATTIVGIESGKQMSISIKGTTNGTYNQNYSADNEVLNSIIALLSGESVETIITESANIENEALIIYKPKESTEGDNDYWFSTQASVEYNLISTGVLGFGTGSFTASMRNKAGDTFEITDGQYKALGGISQ